MKKYLIFLLFIAIQASAASGKIKKWDGSPAENLEQFTGRYKLMQGKTALFLNLYIENGVLVSKQLWDNEIRPLAPAEGDNFMVSKVNWPVKFIRDKNQKVTQMLVGGHDLWTKVDDKPLNTEAMPASPADYLGKYKITVGGQDLLVEISLKNGKIWATQLWDNGASQLSYTTGDNFIANALGWPIKFIRGADKKITQMQLNDKDVFTKTGN